MPASIISSAIVAAIIGFGSTLALLIAAAQAVGATPQQTGSWVTAICLAKVAETIILSWRYKTPIITAWSTAGLALVGASIGFSMNEAVGSFILAALLLMATGLVPALTAIIARIPTSVSAGMLAGILLPFVLSAAKVAQFDPLFAISMAGVFFVIRMFNPSAAIITVLAFGFIWVVLAGAKIPPLEASTLVVILPHWSLGSLLGLGIPIYLVTMASQNLPGMAVLKTDGYSPPSGPIVSLTGLFSFISAFFGASTTNLAAITAAICTGPDTHKDATKRWLVAFPYAACYLVFALFGASLASLFASLPPAFIALIAGLALLGPLANATTIALSNPPERPAAILTLAVTTSGIAFFGIGAAFWGMLAGLIVIGLQHFKPSK